MDTNASNSSAWGNEFRNRQMLFEQALGNDKPKNSTLPRLRRRKENDSQRSHITEFFDNLPLTSTSSTVSNDSQPTKLTSDETVVKHPPTTVEPLQIKDNTQHYQIPFPFTSGSSAISTESPQSTEVKPIPSIKPRRRNTFSSGYVPIRFRDNPQSTSNPVIHPVIPVSTTVFSNSSQNITSRLTSDENIVEDKTDATQNKSTTKTIQEDVPNLRNESEKHIPIIKPRRRNKDYVSVQFRDNPQSTSNLVIHPAKPVSTTVSSNPSQNITSRLTSDENIVEHPPTTVEPLQIKDNPQSTSNPFILPAKPVSTTVSSNSSQNITSRLTSDENIVEGKTEFISEDSTEVHKKHDENHDLNKEYEDHNPNEKHEHEERIENEHYELNKKQEDYVKHEQDAIQHVMTTKTIEEDVPNLRNESENNFTKTIEDLQRNLRRKEQEIEEQKQISHETSIEMVKWKTLYDDLKCENTSQTQQQKEKDLERENMMALIANLQQNLYEAKTSLLVPSSKLELVKEKLNLLPTEFGRELQLIKESKEAIENMQRLYCL